MQIIFPENVWLVAGLIFILRVVDMSLATLRFMVTLRGHKVLTWVFGFAQSVVFVIALSGVLQNLDDIINIIAYAAGFATGGVIGASIDTRLAIGHTHIRIISSNRGSAISKKLRAEGYGVTEISGRGKDGAVTLINASVRRRNVPKVQQIVGEVDENAFITTEDLRPVRRGFWRA